MHSHREARSGIGSTARRSAGACAAALLTVAALFWACGGTTGHEGDAPLTGASAGADATVAVEAGFDAGITYDAGLFDVDIPFANRPLPDTGAPGDGGGADGQGGGAGYPNCPAWLPVDDKGSVLDASDPAAFTENVGFIPAYYSDDEGGAAPAVVYTADGGTEPVAGGGACAAYPWFPEFDVNCLNYQYAGASAYPPYPPCNWAIGIGKATAGPGAGQARYDLCMNLYTCIQDSGCWRNGGNVCLCGLNDGGLDECKQTGVAAGPCKAQIQAAFELPDLSSGSLTVITHNYTKYFDPLCGSEGLGLTAPCYASPLLEIYNTAIHVMDFFPGQPTRDCVNPDAGD